MLGLRFIFDFINCSECFWFMQEELVTCELSPIVNVEV